MTKITVDELVRGARADALFNEEYTTPKARIRRAMSETLVRLRKGLNLTQAALAERAGWAQPFVAKIERGDAQMITALEGLEQFAQAVDATIVVSFVDPQTAQIRAQVALGEPALPQAVAVAPAVPAEFQVWDDATIRQLQQHARQLADHLDKLRLRKGALLIQDLNRDYPTAQPSVPVAKG
jgi:transcriptional regulator with XRE-family HTH domain